MAQENTYDNIDDVKPLDRGDLGIRSDDKQQLPLLDTSERNLFLQRKAEELKRQIEELQQKQEKDKEKIKENDNRIDEIDDELPDIREKIERKKAELEAKGISLEEHSNAFVKEYDILQSQYENKKEIKEKLKDENAGTKSSMAEDEKVIAELEKQKALLEKMRQQNNQQRVDEAKEDAKKTNAKGTVMTQSNAFLTFMEAIFQAAERRATVKAAEDMAERSVNRQIEREDLKVAKEMRKEDTAFPDSKTAGVADDPHKEVLVVMGHTAEGKDVIRIIDADKSNDYTELGKDDDIVAALKKEHDLPPEEKLTSFVTLRHPDKEALLKALEPVAGKAVKYPEDLHEYVSTDEKIQKVTEAIFANCKVEGTDGGNHYAQYMAGGQKQGEAEQQAPKQEAAQEKKQSGWNLFDYLEQEFQLKKDMLRPEDVQKLESGEPTGLYKLKNGQVVRLRPSMDPITNDMSVSVEVRRKSPDYKGIQKTLSLTEADVKNLKKFGVLDHPVKYGGKTGFIYKDKETNNFLFTNQKDIPISKKLKEQLDVETVRRLKEGKAVHVDNLKDEKGQSYTGWVMVDPKKRQVAPVKKEPAFFVDKEYQIQVKNNNDGARADVVKDDKVAVLKTKQQKNDDGPSAAEGKKVYKDYSEDALSQTEKTTTKTNKLS